MSEFDFEPVHGLPQNLPDGEVLRWQGAPRWGALAVRAFHVRKVALYFGLLILFRIVYVLSAGDPVSSALLNASWLASLAGLAMGILGILAWLYSRSTVYSITDRRIVIRCGVAIPIAVNIPFKVVESAGLRRHGDGIGDIPLVLGGGQSVNYLIMWPNVRPWRFFNAQPMLRCIPDVDAAAEVLTAALRAAVGSESNEEAEGKQSDLASTASATRGDGRSPDMTADPLPSQ
ncbi:MAG: photosynthetic complex putative assembly protein PuhB [Thiohalocapsa sp.]